jgi:hypothetical protein
LDSSPKAKNDPALNELSAGIWVNETSGFWIQGVPTSAIESQNFHPEPPVLKPIAVLGGRLQSGFV